MIEMVQRINSDRNQMSIFMRYGHGTNRTGTVEHRGGGHGRCPNSYEGVPKLNLSPVSKMPPQ